jgi:hypothetical protein
VQHDTSLIELLYDVAVRLGMDPATPSEEQIEHCKALHESLVWVPKLVYQGIYVRFQMQIRAVLFGPDSTSHWLTPNDDGLQLNIIVSEADEQYESSIRVEVTCKYRIHSDDTMELMGELPLKLVAKASVAKTGEMTGFNFRAEVLVEPTVLGADFAHWCGRAAQRHGSFKYRNDTTSTRYNTCPNPKRR